MKSIHGKMLVILISLFGSGWALLMGMSYYSAQHEAEELFDAQLAQSARVLLTLSVHEIEEGGFDRPGPVLGNRHTGHPYEEKLAFQIWWKDGLFMRSANAPATPLSTRAGFSDQNINGVEWRVFRLDDTPLGLAIEVGEHYDVRNELVQEILVQMLWPVLFILPVLTVLIWVGVGRGVAPLRRVAGDVAQRSPNQMQAIPDTDVPYEIRPLTESINRLLARLHDALESERRFTANASHELRTPLAGLRAQAQLALGAGSDGERRQAHMRIVEGVDRSTRLVEQLLALARLDPSVAAAVHQPVDLARMAAEVVGELAPSAHTKGIDLGLVSADTTARISGLPGALRVMFTNLVDNAIRYTPDRGRVDVDVRVTGESVECTVTDTGPGIPPGERERVFDRFYRVTGSPAPGCGLGLSIVHRIAELHGARIVLEDSPEGRGLCVRVRFALLREAR